MRPGWMDRWGFAPITRSSNSISKPGNPRNAVKPGPARQAIQIEMDCRARSSHKQVHSTVAGLQLSAHMLA